MKCIFNFLLAAYYVKFFGRPTVVIHVRGWPRSRPLSCRRCRLVCSREAGLHDHCAFADAGVHSAASLQSQPVRITSQSSTCDLRATVSSKEILELGPDGKHSDSFGSLPAAPEEELQMHASSWGP